MNVIKYDVVKRSDFDPCLKAYIIYFSIHFNMYIRYHYRDSKYSTPLCNVYYLKLFDWKFKMFDLFLGHSNNYLQQKLAKPTVAQ
jgi:hypothetical protein